MKNLCRRCGAELPENASFCPHCETPLREKRPVRPPHPWRRKAGICAGVLLVGFGDLSHLALGGFPAGDL